MHPRSPSGCAECPRLGGLLAGIDYLNHVGHHQRRLHIFINGEVRLSLLIAFLLPAVPLPVPFLAAVVALITVIAVAIVTVRRLAAASTSLVALGLPLAAASGRAIPTGGFIARL